MRRRSVLSDRHLGQSCTSFYRDDLKNSELSELLNGVGLTSGSVPQAEEEDLFDEVSTARFVGATLTALTASIGATAQSYYNDQICRQYADAQIAPLRDQINSQAVGGTLLGTGLGAALGGAIGVGRGVGIGAASGAIVGTGVGAANAQNAAGYLQQQYNPYYAQCMASRRYTAPPFRAPVPSYGPEQGYALPPNYLSPGR
jgi:hypothetical protein